MDTTGPRTALDGPRTAALDRGPALLEEVLSEAERKYPVRRKVELGDPAATPIAIAADERAHLLVVGAGAGTGPAASLGSVSRELAMRASCPVIVVPRGAESPRTPASARRLLLCAFDGSDDAQAALSVAAAVAKRLRAVAFVAHVGPGSVGQLEARARTERPALIVTASCGAQGWDAGLPGSAPVRLATCGSTPVLFVPPAYREAPCAPLPVAAAVPSAHRRPRIPHKQAAGDASRRVRG